MFTTALTGRMWHNWYRESFKLSALSRWATISRYSVSFLRYLFLRATIARHHCIIAIIVIVVVVSSIRHDIRKSIRVGESGGWRQPLPCHRSTLPGVYSPGKQRRLETANRARKEFPASASSHNGTVRVTSFLTTCQVASLTARPGPSLLCHRRQLDVARRWRLLLRATTRCDAGRRWAASTSGRRRRLGWHKASTVASPRLASACLASQIDRRPHVGVWSVGRNWNGANESAASGIREKSNSGDISPRPRRLYLFCPSEGKVCWERWEGYIPRLRDEADLSTSIFQECYR